MSKSLDVLAIGSCYVDTNLTDYPFGDQGIPTEVELVGSPYETVAGGSAVNFCSLLRKLGLSPAFVGMAGTDSNGDLLARLLEEQGITSALIRRSDVLTNISFNMTNPNGKHIMLVAGSANAALNAGTALPELEHRIPQAKMLYLGGCFKLKSLAPAFPQIAEVAHRYESALVVDHGRIPQGISGVMLDAVRRLVLGADYYFPSREEFCTLWEVANIEAGLGKLQELAPHLMVVVKDGANGAYYSEGGSIRHRATKPVAKVVNATGAGDSFNAGVITALLKGRPLTDAASYGCAVAAAQIKAEDPPAL